MVDAVKKLYRMIIIIFWTSTLVLSQTRSCPERSPSWQHWFPPWCSSQRVLRKQQPHIMSRACNNSLAHFPGVYLVNSTLKLMLYGSYDVQTASSPCIVVPLPLSGPLIAYHVVQLAHWEAGQQSEQNAVLLRHPIITIIIIITVYLSSF